MTGSPKAVESVYWMSNKKWYRINREKDCFELTEEATERARKSFLLYCEMNGLNEG